MAKPPTNAQWLGVMSFFTIIASLLMLARIYFDVRRFRKVGLLPSAVVSTACAVGAWLCFLAACGMAFWRSQRRNRAMDQAAEDDLVKMAALGLPLREATIMHSYIVPTGLWLVKASFVAMYFTLKRHVSRGLRFLLHCVLIYVILSYVVLVLTHVLWCGAASSDWVVSAAYYCTPFASTGSISIYTVMNISSDVLVMAMPVLMIRHMTIRSREKLAIAFLLLLGGAMIATTAICCGLHITYRRDLIVAYSAVQFAELLACIELAVAIAAVSLPSLRAVLYNHRESALKRLTPITATKRSTVNDEVPLSPLSDYDDDEEAHQLEMVKTASRRVAPAGNWATNHHHHHHHHHTAADEA